MILDVLPVIPYNFDSAQDLSEFLLDGARDIPLQTGDVLASLMAFIINSRPDDSQWSWPELHSELLAVTDCGESNEQPIDTFLDAWFDLLHAPGLEIAATAVDSTATPYFNACAVRSAIRVVALPAMQRMCA